MTDEKPIYKSISLPARAWNRVQYSHRYTVGFIVLVIIALWRPILSGNKNMSSFEARDEWIKTVVREPKTEGLEYLDEEEAPIPLPILTPFERFRKEFNKKREAQEKRFW